MINRFLLFLFNIHEERVFGHIQYVVRSIGQRANSSVFAEIHEKMFISLDEVNLIGVKFIEDLKFGCHFYVILMYWMSF